MEQKTRAQVQNEQNAQALHQRLVATMRSFIQKNPPIGERLAVTIFAGATRVTTEKAQQVYNDATNSGSL